MRFLTLSTVIALLMAFYVTSSVQAQDNANAPKVLGFFLVSDPSVNVYKELDPKSPIIRQAKKGEYLKLLYEGETWHKVAIDNEDGWVEKKSGKIVQNEGGVSGVVVALLIVIIAGALIGVFSLLKKNQTPSAVGINEDL